MNSVYTQTSMFYMTQFFIRLEIIQNLKSFKYFKLSFNLDNLIYVNIIYQGHYLLR